MENKYNLMKNIIVFLNKTTYIMLIYKDYLSNIIPSLFIKFSCLFILLILYSYIFIIRKPQSQVKY